MKGNVMMPVSDKTLTTSGDRLKKTGIVILIAVTLMTMGLIIPMTLGQTPEPKFIISPSPPPTNNTDPLYAMVAAVVAAIFSILGFFKKSQPK